MECSGHEVEVVERPDDEHIIMWRACAGHVGKAECIRSPHGGQAEGKTRIKKGFLQVAPRRPGMSKYVLLAPDSHPKMEKTLESAHFATSQKMRESTVTQTLSTGHSPNLKT